MMRWTSWPERAQDADTKPRSRGSPAWAPGVLPELPTDPARQAQYTNSVAAACRQNGPDDARQIARRDGVEMPRAAFEGLDNFKSLYGRGEPLAKEHTAVHDK